MEDAALWCHLPFGSAVWRLNLSSAVYGALAAVLLCRYVAQWVYARISSGDAKCAKKESLVAIVSGVVAAVLFGTGLTGWSAATRFHPGLFSLVLVLVAFSLHQDYLYKHGLLRVYALAFLCGLGAVETPMFLVITPFFVVTVLVFFYRHHRLNTNTCLGLLVTGLLGASLYFLFAWLFSRTLDPAVGGANGWEEVFRATAKRQVIELRAFVPAVGWPMVLLFVAAPWVAFQTGYWSKLHSYRDYRADGLHFLLVVCVLLLQLNTPIAPWSEWLRTQRLPVLEMALFAMLGGWTCAYWLYGCLFDWDSVVIVSAKQGSSLKEFIRLKKRQSLVVTSLLGLLLVVAVVCNGIRANGRRGDIADRCAQEILDQMGERTWLVTDGVLDTHLTILAERRGKKMRLLDLTSDREVAQSRKVRRWIDEEPRLQPYRAKLRNAASLGIAAFLREWLAIDPEAETALALYGVPSFLTEAGLTARPDRFLFLATRSPESLRALPLLEEQRAFWKRMRQMLPHVDEARDPIDRLGNLLRRHLSLVANDLGVLLVDLKRSKEAYSAFDEVLLLDPENLSAKLNQAILIEEGVHPENKEMVVAAIKKAFDAFRRKPTPFEIVCAYGQIRSAQALAGVGAEWARLGHYGLAQGEIQRAADLAKDDRMKAALASAQGGVRLAARDAEKGEAIFRELLSTQPDNALALMGLLESALQRGDTAAARGWLAKAQAARANLSSLVMAEARIEIAERKYDVSSARLLELLDKEPQNLDAWALLAVVMIHQGRSGDVERLVLSKMDAVAGTQPNPLVFQVRGAVARAKGPASYGAARDAYRCALAMMPGQRDLIEIVLDLDLAMGDDASAERDANDLLRADDDNARAHFFLGTQALVHGDVETAEWHLRRSVVAGGGAEAWNNLAGLLQRRGDLDEAESCARQAVVKADKVAAYFDTLAAVLLDKGKTDEAKTVVEQARSLAPQDWQVAFTAARILKRAGQPEEARILLRQVLAHLEEMPPAVQAEVARVVQEWKSRQ